MWKIVQVIYFCLVLTKVLSTFERIKVGVASNEIYKDYSFSFFVVPSFSLYLSYNFNILSVFSFFIYFFTFKCLFGLDGDNGLVVDSFTVGLVSQWVLPPTGCIRP